MLPGFSADVFVDSASPNATNLFAGTKERPYKSLRLAAARASPGDTIRVNGGVYRETVTIREGTPAAPISVVAEPGTTPLITGADQVPGPWESRGGGRYCTRWARATQIVLADGQPLKQIGKFLNSTPKGWKQPSSMVEGDESSLRPGTFYYSEKTKRLWVRLADGSAPGGHRIEASTRSLGVLMRSHTRMTGFDVAHAQSTAEAEGNGIVVRGEDIQITRCNAHHNDFSGIYPQASNTLIKDCVASLNGNNGLTSNIGDSITLEGCTTRDNNTRGYDMAWHGGGLKFVQQRRLTINNHRAENEAMGLWLDINCLDTTVANSSFKTCNVGIYYEISRWGVLVNNVFEDCKRGVWSYSSDVLIANNAFLACGQSIVLTGAPRFAEYRLGYVEEPGLSDKTLAAMRNNFIVNNLIVNSKETNIAIWPDNSSTGGQVCDFNYFVRTSFTSGLDDFSFWTTWGKRVSVSDWQERGFDKNSLFCWPSAPTGPTTASAPALQVTGATVSAAPPDHPITGTGRLVEKALIRGETNDGRPWALTLGRPTKHKALFEFDNLWFNEWQRLPVKQEIAKIQTSTPVTTGPLEAWRDISSVPAFAR